MSTMTTMLDETISEETINPGEQLASIRQQKGYSIDYVANKLHLRGRVIELLESNQFDLLPGPVFIKGYLRAYARLLDIAPEPYLELFNKQHVAEKKPERALWQSKRESHKGDNLIRWFTLLFAVGVIVAVGLWWQKSLDNPHLFSGNESTAELSMNPATPTEIKLTDISKMQSLLNPKQEMSPLENISG